MKLHLPKTFLTAVLMAVAGMVTPTMAAVTTQATTVDGHAYSGSVITYEGTSNNQGIGTSGVSFNVLTPDGESRNVPGASTNPSSYLGGSSAHLWHYLTYTTSTALYGQTIRLNGSTTQAVKLFNNGMGNLSFGGVITELAEGGTTGSYTLDGVGSTVDLAANATTGLDMSIGANTTINTTGTIAVHTGGEWTIDSGKTLKLSGGRIAVDDGAAISVQGAGNLAFNGSLVLNGSSSLSLADGTGIVLDNVTKAITAGDAATTGLQTVTTTYTLATGDGSVTKDGTINLTANGAAVTAAQWAADNKSVSTGTSGYNVAAGDSVSLADVMSAIDGAGTPVNAILADGTITGFSTTAFTHQPSIVGNGTVQVNGEMQYHTAGEGHTYLNGFTGTLEIADGGVLQGGNSSSVFSDATTIKVTEGGTLRAWGQGGWAHAIVLDGGKLSGANGSVKYTGAITVESDSTISAEKTTENTATTVTLAGKVDVKAGTLTTHGNVVHNADLDLNGSSNPHYTGSLTVADGSYSTSANVWFNATNRDVLIKENASFKLIQSNGTAKMTVLASEGDATISLTGSTTTNYATNKNSFKISNAEVTFGTTNETLTNALENVTVTGGKSVNGETGAVTYHTTVNSTSMSNVTLKDVNLNVGNSLSGVTLDNVTYTANAAYLNIGGTVNMGDFTNNMSGNSSNNYGIIVGANGKLNITGAVDLTKKSDGTANANAHVAGANGTATVTVKEGGHLTTDLFLNSSQTKASNGNLVVEAGGQLDVIGTGNHHAYSFSNAGTTFINSGLYIYDGTLTNSGDLTLCSGNISYTNVVLGGGTVSIYNRSSEAEHVYGVADEATLTVTHQLTVNDSSTVNADIVVAANGVVSFTQGTVTLGCSVTFGEGSTVALGTAYLDELAANGKVLLFTDVESYSDNLESIIVTGDFQAGHLFAESYTAEGGVTKYNIYATPEPATATLSLLALAGLMARRRRH